MEPINILCSADNNYAAYCGIMLTSLYENNRDHDISVYLLTDGLNDRELKKFKEFEQHYNTTINIITVRRESFKFCPIREGDHVSLAAYYRIACANILPENLDKILYLDCDMIITSSITELWNYNINGVACGAVIDEGYTNSSIYKRLGYDDNKSYFNSGMLLINLKYWRKHNVVNRCFSCIKKMPERLLFHDQDTLNIVLQDEKVLLPVRYNFQTGFLFYKSTLPNKLMNEVLNTISSPTIIHYTGPNKPWIEKSQHPYAEFYKHYKKLSLWEKYPYCKLRLVDKLIYYRNQIIWSLNIKKRPKTYIIDRQKTK